MPFSVLIFLCLSCFSLLSFLSSMLVWFAVPALPLILIYLLLLLPFSIVYSYLFAQLFHYNGGPWSKSGGRWTLGLP